MSISKKNLQDKAAEQDRRERIMERANKAYSSLKDNPKEWEEELAERAVWDSTLLDGLDDTAA